MKSRRCPQWVSQMLTSEGSTHLKCRSTQGALRNSVCFQSWQENLWDYLFRFVVFFCILDLHLLHLHVCIIPYYVWGTKNSEEERKRENGVSDLPGPSSSGCPKGWQWAPTPEDWDRRNDLIEWQYVSFLSLGAQTVHTHTHTQQGSAVALAAIDAFVALAAIDAFGRRLSCVSLPLWFAVYRLCCCTCRDGHLGVVEVVRSRDF